MKPRKGSRIVGALLGLVGYAVASIALLLTNASDATGALFIFAILFSPAAIAAGAVAGGAFGKQSLLGASVGGCAVGVLLPLFAFFIGISISGFQDQGQRLAHDGRSKSAYNSAKERGFIFPEDAEQGIAGEVLSKQSPSRVVAFYQTNLGKEWEMKPSGKNTWFVRKATDSNQFDRILVQPEYGRTLIRFATVSQQELKVMAAQAFALAIGGFDGPTSRSWCTPDCLADLGPGGISGKLGGLKPDSSPFMRKVFRLDAKAPIGINAKIDLGDGMYRTGEIGLEMTDDLIPLVRRIETLVL